ncbi:MAG: hypothetical protein AAFY58_06065, partial [Planctomycetota bacterium]
IVDYGAEMQRVVAEAQPPGTNAWPEIIAAADLMAILRTEAEAAIQADPATPGYTDRYSIDFDALVDTSWQADLSAEDDNDRFSAEQTRVNAAMATRALTSAESTDLFNLLDTIAAAPRAVRPIQVDGPLINLLLPELRNARDIARLSAARAHIAATAGDHAQAVRSIEHNLALARHFRVQATLIDHLVGLAIEAITLEVIGDWLANNASSPPSEETLAALAAIMDGQHSNHTVAQSIASESIWALDMIQWTHTPGGRAIPTAFSTVAGTPPGTLGLALGGAPPAVANLAGFIMPSARETQRVLTEIYELLAEYAAPPRADREDIDAQLKQMLFSNWLAEAMIPAVSKAANTADLAHIHWNLTRTALAIELHRARTGSLPATLADLTEPNAPSFTKDPVTNDAQLHYSINTTQPTTFTLYSIGLDCTNDNATPSPDPRRAEPGDVVWGQPADND